MLASIDVKFSLEYASTLIIKAGFKALPVWGGIMGVNSVYSLNFFRNPTRLKRPALNRYTAGGIGTGEPVLL